MKRLFLPTSGPSDWRRLLADPERQWRAGKSAYESAVAWEAARTSDRGLPPDVAHLLDTHSAFRGASLLIGLPEHQVPLKGAGHASQTDLWALLKCPGGLVSVAVEAKAGEGFDQYVEPWLKEATPKSAKPARLRFLCEILEIDEAQASKCRYQLLHRPVAAILEAQRFGVGAALFLVHAFGDNGASFEDFIVWAGLLGVRANAGEPIRVGSRGGVDFWIAWLDASCASCETMKRAV